MRSKFKWIFTLLVALTVQFSFAQEKTVTGVVSDELGPIAGANIVVQGTSRGTTTDFDGNYTIKAKQGETLVFSYTGKKQATVSVGAANTYNVTLKDDVIQGEEVVVLGIVGVARKAEAVTSAYQKVNKEELKQAANPNAIQALAGKVTGLQINTTNNGVNQTNSIVLRGARSISGSNEALIVIDNVISTNEVLSNLAPEVIESVNVLKGGQGAALYGEKGVNGVVVVTTKRGDKAQKFGVDVSSSITFEDVAYMAQRQERYGQGWSGNHVTYENGAWGAEMDGVMRTVGMPQADGTYIMAPYSPIKDNVKKFFQTGTVFQNAVTLSGATDTANALLTINNQQTDFVVDNDKLNRTTALFKAGAKLGKWSLDGNVQFIKSRTNTTTSDLLTELYQAATNIPVEQFKNSGNEGHWTSYYRNPYWRMQNERFERRLNNLNAQATIGYRFNDNIGASVLYNVTSRNTDGMDYINEYIDNIKLGGGDHTTNSFFSQFNSGQIRTYSDMVVNFDYDLTEKLEFGLDLGFNMQDNRYKISTQEGSNLVIPGLYTISNALNPVSLTYDANGNLDNGSTRNRLFAYFANLDLGFNDYLFLNATARIDYNSNFNGGLGENNYFYPSVGLSFIPTKAIEGLKGDVLNAAKVYASYVRNGNSSILDPYDINPTMNPGSGFPFGDLNSFGNNFQPTFAGLKPEFMTTTEFGVNLGFFKDRLTLDFSAYRTITDDLITNISPSYASGLSRILTNIGEMENKGFEIDLGFTPINNKELGLKWENRLGYSTYKSVVNKVSDEANEVALASFTEIGIFAVEGEEFPTIKGTAYQRDDQGRVILDPTTGNPLRAEGLKILGKATPDYILNYNTSVTFKNFRLSASMDYRTGHQFWSGTKDWLAWSGHLYESAENGRTGFIFPNSSIPDTSNPGSYVANTSVVTGGNTYTQFLSYFQDEYSDIAENFVLDATAFKVRELALSYSFKPQLIERTGLSNLTIGVNARNPFMVLPKENRGYSDPEISRSSGNDKGLSVVGQYPITRTFAFTLNASF